MLPLLMKAKAVLCICCGAGGKARQVMPHVHWVSVFSKVPLPASSLLVCQLCIDSGTENGFWGKFSCEEFYTCQVRFSFELMEP